MSDSGVSLINTFNLGCCNECWSVVKEPLLKELSAFPVELPEHLTGFPPRFKKYDNRKCSKCGWIGSERLMGRKRTMIGDGWYPASCPECKAENAFFGPTIIGSADGFELFPVEQENPPSRI